MNIATHGNHSSSCLYKKYIKIRLYIELYQHPAASLFQCIFAWLLITVKIFEIQSKIFIKLKMT